MLKYTIQDHEVIRNQFEVNQNNEQVNENLECVKYPGIYIAGEVLDVDGDCGGYNLHFAFASGYHIAKTISKGR